MSQDVENVPVVDIKDRQPEVRTVNSLQVSKSQSLPVNLVMDQDPYCIIETCIRGDVYQVLHVIENV